MKPIYVLGTFLEIFINDFKGRVMVYFRPKEIKFAENKPLIRADLLSYDGLCIGKAYRFCEEPWSYFDPFETHQVSLPVMQRVLIPLAFFELEGKFIRSKQSTKMMFCAAADINHCPTRGKLLNVFCGKGASTIALFSIHGFSREHQEEDLVLPDKLSFTL